MLEVGTKSKKRQVVFLIIIIHHRDVMFKTGIIYSTDGNHSG